MSAGLRAEAIDALKRVGEDDAAATVKLIDQELVTSREALHGDQTHQQTEIDNRAIMTAAAIGFAQQVSGVEAILYYSSDFLDDAGMSSDLSQMLGELAIGLCKLLPVLVLFDSIDNFGRRTYLIGSATGVTIVLLFLVVGFMAGDEPHVIVVLLCCYMLCFSSGMGLVTCKTTHQQLVILNRAPVKIIDSFVSCNVSGTVTSEMLPTHLRTRGMVAVAFSNRMASGITAMSTLSIVNYVGYTGLFAWYAVISLSVLLLYIVLVPETSRRSLEDITAASRRKD